MANPSFKYTVMLCFIVLALFHVHECAETETNTRRLVHEPAPKQYVMGTPNGVKINGETQVKARGTCVLTRPYGGDYLWCCYWSDYETCYDEKWECDRLCNSDPPPPSKP